jgi:hypothetical protein
VKGLVLTALVAACWVGAAPAADTQNAANTRNKKLQVKVTVDFDELFLKDCLEELKKQIDDAGAGSLSWQFDLGVSMNLRCTAKAKDKPVADVLDLMFKKVGLGYIVVSKEKDRYDGWLLIKQGKERGYKEGEEPKAAKDKDKDKAAAKEKDKAAPKENAESSEDKLEQRAASRLSQAKQLAKDGKKAKAKEYCEEILKSYSKTKAADGARELLKDLER